VADAAQRLEEMQAGSFAETRDVQETAREQAEELKETVRESSTQLTSTARDWMQREADERTSAIASQARTIADAMRETSSKLNADGQPQAARVTETVAERVDAFAGYLEQADGVRLMDDAQDAARRNPWAVAAAGLFIGFAASRFMKASRSQTTSAGTLPATAREYPTKTSTAYAPPSASATAGDLPAAPGTAGTAESRPPTGVGAFGETGATGA
jgi:gas vesicle protein